MGRGRTPKFSVQEMAKALEESKGLVSIAARRLKCSPTTVRSYMKLHPTVQQVVDDQSESLVDIAELKLLEAVQVRGEPWAIALVLKTKGKNRGYVEKTQQEISAPGGGPLEVRHEHRLSYDEYAVSLEDLATDTARLELAPTNGHQELVDTA